MPKIQSYAMRTNPPPPGFWRTKEGRLLRLVEMEDSHILNCIALLESSYEGMMQKMADRSGRVELLEEAVAKERIDAVIPQHKALKEEMERRRKEAEGGNIRSFQFDP